MIDPTTVRLSDHFLLSDTLGCHSVYTKGYPNVWSDPDGSKLKEGRYLAETVLEGLVERSPLTICYGYISLDLARKIVTYQSPEKPSYHQWNDGAAVDVCLHDTVDRPTIATAAWIDEEFPMSRTITYSESDFICIATRVRERTAPRHALYENRYIPGQKKPQYINYPDNHDKRTAMLEKAIETVEQTDWRGAGYPTYHGGGIRQLHHIRVGKHCTYEDFLYSRNAVHHGRVNVLTPTMRNIARMREVGAIYDELLAVLGINYLSIVKGYESPRWSEDEHHTWVEGPALVVAPPLNQGITASDVADAAAGLGAMAYGASNSKNRATMFFRWKRYNKPV